MYLFIFWLCWVFIAVRAFSLVVVSSLVVTFLVSEHELKGVLASVTGAPGRWSAGSVVVAHGLSCPVACGIFLDQRLNLRLLHWPVGSLLLSHQGSPVTHLG